jgi:hypothetical protein
MADRSVKIAAYGAAYETLVEALARFPREMWKFRPQGGWSIHEIVVHIADSEANSYVRCRRFLAEPGSDLMAYDENRWAVELDYHSQDTEEALELFRLLRHRTWGLIRSLPEQAWSRACRHPENGTMTLADWLDVYERHVPEHIAQMDEVHRAWLVAGMSG